MTKLYLIRHAFTPANNASYNNQKGLWKIARDKDMPIERVYGVKQALELGNFLNGLKGKILIYVSPYYRVKQTLGIALFKMHGNYDIRELEGLREFNSGVHYAHTIDEVLEMYPESKKYFEDAKKDLDSAVYTGGESRNMVKARVKDVALMLQEEVLSNEYDYILVFGHGMTNRYIYYHLTGDNLKDDMKNCEVLSVSDKKSLFRPKAFVPKGFMVDISRYIDLVNNELEKDDVKSLEKVLTKKG